MTEPDPQLARAAIFEIIENQMRDETPIEIKQTYDRLIADGHSHEETMKMIGRDFSSEIFDVVKRNQTFNQERYVAGLKALPELPWANDED
jgi:hypothetical protein